MIAVDETQTKLKLIDTVVLKGSEPDVIREHLLAHEQKVWSFCSGVLVRFNQAPTFTVLGDWLLIVSPILYVERPKLPELTG